MGDWLLGMSQAFFRLGLRLWIRPRVAAVFQKAKLPSEAWGQWGGFLPRFTLHALFSGGSGNFHMVSFLPCTMNYYLDEKPVGRWLKREVFSE